jgi:hypothetical protein
MSTADDLRIPAGCEVPAQVVLTVAEKMLGEPVNTGGCRAFYSPQEWEEREEEYGLNADLIVVHDGGDLTEFFDWNRCQYSWIEKMSEALEAKGYFVEQCTCWYSAIYKEETVHDLKTWPEFFNAVEHGAKSFEIRKDDRNFQVGDILCLREWDPATKDYTGRSIRKTIRYILRDALQFGLQEGYAILGFEGEDMT